MDCNCIILEAASRKSPLIITVDNINVNTQLVSIVIDGSKVDSKIALILNTHINIPYAFLSLDYPILSGVLSLNRIEGKNNIVVRSIPIDLESIYSYQDSNFIFVDNLCGIDKCVTYIVTFTLTSLENATTVSLTNTVITARCLDECD